MEKQIEEMAKVICSTCRIELGPCECCEDPCQSAIKEANALYNAGCRMQSDVANKICCEIEKEIAAALESNYMARINLEEYEELYHIVNGKISALRGIEGFVEELKKKFTNN